MVKVYARGKIYQIECHVTNQVYIGSTTKKYLQQRLRDHEKGHAYFLATGRKRLTSHEVLKNGNYTLSMLEMYPCSSKDELLARERHYIEATPNCVNKNLPGRGRAEYRRDKVEKIRDYNRDYQARPEVKAKMKDQRKRYEQTDQYKRARAYRDKMKADFGDLYCNSLTSISWDVFK